MKPASPLSALALRKQPPLSYSAFEGLLEQLEQPALLLETRTWRVLIGNSNLSELTAFTRLELASMDLRSLFVDFDLKMVAGVHNEQRDTQDFLIRRHKGQPILVSVTPESLDPQKKWLLLVMEPASRRDTRIADMQRQAVIWDAVQLLAALPQRSEEPSILKETLEAGSALLGAEILTIYLGEGKDYMLTRRASIDQEQTLPDQVNPQDMIAMQTAHIWTPHRRSLSSLHRAARASNLGYLATTPLGQQNAMIGLLVAGSHSETTPDNLLELLEILGATITTILQNQAVSTTLTSGRHLHEIQSAFTTALISTVQDGVIVLKPNGCIQELNQAAESILGYATSEVLNHPYGSILVGSGGVIPDFVSNLSDPAIQDLGSINLYRRDGRTFLAHVRIAPIFSRGKLENLLVLIQDLSQEEQYRIRSQQLEQRAILGEVTAIFAHEVKNPINSISTGLQWLAMNTPTDDPKQQDISRMLGDCERLAELMKSVLTFAKPMEYKIEAVDLERSLTRLIERYRPTLAKGKVKAEVSAEPNTPPAEGDQRALEQVWTNLINNAIKAMRENGGKLSIKIRPVVTPDHVQMIEVSVSDTGCGIPENIREHIFEPFVTSDSSSGTGLGLSITRHIISTHRGNIKVTSVPGGTVFQVQLPQASGSK